MENSSPGVRHAGNICCLLIEMIGVFGDSVGGENQHVKAGVVVGLFFPGCPLFCLDLNFTNLFIAHKYICPRAFCMQLDASKPLPFSSGTLDGVFSTDALHYLPDKALAAREIHRCLTSGGWAILSHNHNVNIPQSHD